MTPLARIVRPRTRTAAGGDPAAPHPFPGLERRLAQAPVHFDARHGNWLVLGYDAVKAALADTRAFSSAPQAGIDPVLLGADPPGHGRARALLARHFDADAVRRLAAAAEAAAPALIRPPFDLVAGFARPLTRRVSAVSIGGGGADVDEILAAVQSGRAAGGKFSGVACYPDAVRRVRLYRELRESLGENEACSLVTLMCIAAIETSERAISRAMLTLFEHPPLRERLERDTALIPPFFEEVLRLYPPVPVISRTAPEEVELAGVRIPAGARVRLNVACANRDPAHFAEPNAIRLDRRRRLHLSFGHGPHVCLGAGAGRRVAQAALAALLVHRPALRPLAPLGEVSYALPPGAAAPARLTVGE